MSPQGAGQPEVVASLLRRVQVSIEEVGLRDAALVVAVSGGPDSLALLHVLVELRESLGLTLWVAHLDHGLRLGSVEDARFVAETSRGLGLPGLVEKCDVRTYQKEHRLSLEQAAREVRYSFLSRVVRQVGATAVALGHTADDQAETLLLHLVRGSGLTGLRGMQPVSSYHETDGMAVTLLRPLLEVGREETEAYCQARELVPRRDETNWTLELPRSYLRLEVLPRLARLNPVVREALGRLARSATLDVEYLESQVERVWPLVVHPQPQGAALYPYSATHSPPVGLALERQPFQALHPSLQRHLLRAAYSHVQGQIEGLQEGHVEQMIHLLEGHAGTVLDLPAGLRFEVQRSRALLTRGPAPCPLPLLVDTRILALPGESCVGEGWRVRTEVGAPSDPPTFDAYTAVLDADILGATLEVRSRRPGDRFQPLGIAAAGEEGVGKRGKKLQDFMVDAHIPRSWRGRVPLLVAPQGVAWVVGWRIAHWCRITSRTRRVLSLAFTLNQE